MTPIFSVIHATHGRPQKAANAMRMWLERAAIPGDVQYITCADESDESRFDMVRATSDIRGFGQGVYVEHPGNGSAPAWDFAAKFSCGTVMIQAQDDVEPPVGWDEKIMERLERMTVAESLQSGAIRTWFTCPVFIAVSDGYRKDRLCCTAIMTRAYYEQKGEFIHAGYRSVFSDDDVTIRAYADAADGKCTLIEARDIVFLHRHHYHDKSVPMDATYERENSAEAYRIGQELFMRRNSALVARGLRTW